MLDGSGSLTGKAAKEIKEEAHLHVTPTDLLNMSALALEDDDAEHLQQAMYPSPGACDEFIPLFLCQKRLTRRHIEWLRGRATGLRSEGENISLSLVPLERLWKEGARDGKALAALALYEGLKREGRLPDMPAEVETEPGDVCD
ncbi:NUDIX family hydrolase [Pyrenophora seminiperda CCB06]|uniref:NUDIX family hydrolase n=1 Tax=Pyrenophora seminiperda CCB06 TaxID=1302712 RepID=A0A3M7LZX6_9PLEO|nr:NUDIX family hydrolase [Pyrenophora seminiperda CCB06]